MAREYNIARSSGACRLCQKELAAGDEYVAALFDDGEGFRREDFCPGCWPAQTSGRAFSIWQAKVPPVAEAKRTFVDTEVLVDFFTKLAGAEEPAKVNFRFVLALMLMRKKVLIYDGSAAAEGGEVWTMRLKADPAAPISVVRPELDERQIAEVTEQLSMILEVEK
jgi:hypothetical protein